MLIYKFKGERQQLIEHMSGRSLVLIDTAREQRSKRRPWQLKGKRAEAQGFVYSTRPPAMTFQGTKSGASATDCCFCFHFIPQGMKTDPTVGFLYFPLTLVSTLYLYHLCMVTTPWAFPAFQGRTIAPPPPSPCRELFSLANRLHHSTRPDNHSQLGAIYSQRHCSLSAHNQGKHTHERAQEHGGIST